MSPKNGSNGAMYFELEEITPEKAVEYLQLNSKSNRPISEHLVKTIAEDMTNDRFVTTHEAIAFDSDANLIDGQHRLHAIVRAKKTQTMWVAYNCDPKTFNKVNIGRVRTSADLFAIAYKKKFGSSPASSTYIASIATAMIQGLKQTGPEKDETWTFALKHYKLIASIREQLPRSSVMSTQVQGAFANALLVFGDDRVAPLMERFRTEMWSSSNDPMKALHQRLYKDKLREERGHILSKRERYGVTVSAIRAALNGETRTKLEASSQDFGEAEPDRRLLNAIKQAKKQARETATA